MPSAALTTGIHKGREEPRGWKPEGEEAEALGTHV
jgi:hypothetical protein